MSGPAFPRTAFILGAGLGTRLRPLTEVLPKPLIPVGQAPLMHLAMAHASEAGVERFIVNTHHLADRYRRYFPGDRWEDHLVQFVHEPEVLETGGGLWNIEGLLAPEEPLLIYNGDVLATLDLGLLWSEHRRLGAEVTLGLLREGGPIQVNFDEESGQVRDLGQRLRPDEPSTALFTGIYIVEPAFRQRLLPGCKESVVQVWLRMIQAGHPVAGVWLDGTGHWRDLGKREEYLRVIADISHSMEGGAFDPSWSRGTHFHQMFSPDTEVHPSAQVLGACQIGAGVKIGADAVIQDSILWPGSEIAPGTRLRHCIVTGRGLISGDHFGVDL